MWGDSHIRRQLRYFSVLEAIDGFWNLVRNEKGPDLRKEDSRIERITGRSLTVTPPKDEIATDSECVTSETPEKAEPCEPDDCRPTPEKRRHLRRPLFELNIRHLNLSDLWNWLVIKYKHIHLLNTVWKTQITSLSHWLAGKTSVRCWIFPNLGRCWCTFFSDQFYLAGDTCSSGETNEVSPCVKVSESFSNFMRIPLPCFYVFLSGWF